MKLSQCAIDAAELIEHGGWTQGAEARDANGNKVSALSDFACSWCAMGALRRVADSTRLTGADKIAVIAGLPLTPILSLHPLATFNDDRDRTKEEVINLLREAGTKLKERGE